MKLTQIVDRTIAFQRSYVYLTKSVTAALMLAQAVYWSNRTTLSGGWFYKTRDEWELETGLTRYEQESSRKILRELGILEESLRNVPAKMHYRLNDDVLQSSLLEIPYPVGGKTTNKMVEDQPTCIGTEITTEITAESSSPKKKDSSVDSRHTPFRESFDRYYQHMKKVPAPWDGKEARNLSLWLKKNPTITLDQWRVILNNRARSPVSHASELSRWLGKALNWIDGPADEWGKSLGGSGGTSKAQLRSHEMADTRRETIQGIFDLDSRRDNGHRSDVGGGGNPRAITIDSRSCSPERSRARQDGEGIRESQD